MNKNKKIKKTAIKFAEWINTSGYDNIFRDINNDGKTWINYNNNELDLSFNKCKRYTIKQIYKAFLLDNNLK